MEHILRLLRHEASVDLYPTSAPGDAVRAAQAACAKGVDAVIAAGGDGTINEVLNGLAESGVPLGVIPGGTANVLAAELDIPSDPAALAALIGRGPVRDVWVGRANGRRFALMASAGFDADVVRDVNPALKRAIGKGAFVCAFVEGLIFHSPKRLVVRVDGRSLPASQVLVAKASKYGGNFIAAPDISVDRPEFCVYVVNAPTRRGILGLAAALVQGRLSAHPSVEMLHARDVLLESEDQAVIQADGEVIGTLPARITIDRRQARVIAPVPGAPVLAAASS
jgi:YegS/Rv2252/BmrU family lipid kinase